MRKAKTPPPIVLLQRLYERHLRHRDEVTIARHSMADDLAIVEEIPQPDPMKVTVADVFEILRYKLPKGRVQFVLDVARGYYLIVDGDYGVGAGPSPGAFTVERTVGDVHDEKQAVESLRKEAEIL